MSSACAAGGASAVGALALDGSASSGRPPCRIPLSRVCAGAAAVLPSSISSLATGVGVRLPCEGRGSRSASACRGCIWYCCSIRSHTASVVLWRQPGIILWMRVLICIISVGTLRIHPWGYGLTACFSTWVFLGHVHHSSCIFCFLRGHSTGTSFWLCDFLWHVTACFSQGGCFPSQLETGMPQRTCRAPCA